MRLKTSMFCAFFVLMSLSAVAQHTLRVRVGSEEERKVLAGINYKRNLPDSAAAQQQKQKLITQLHERGYLMATAKEIPASSDTTFLQLFVGKKFQWGSLSVATINEHWLNKTLWRQKLYTDKPFHYRQVARLMQQLIVEAENSGYPFACVKLDSVKIEGESFTARLQMEQGPFIVFDTLVLLGNSRISPRFLASLLDIHAGEPYSQQRVKDAAVLLRNLPYIRVQQAPKVSFQNHQASIYLELEDKKSSVIDGVVGLLPDPQAAERLLFTGQFDLLLQNPFGTGKRIELHWQGLNRNSQNLEASYFHPYLLGSVISMETGFSLLKEEERFVNRQLLLELQFRQGASNMLRIIAMQKNSRLLSAGPESGFAGFDLAQFGLGFSRQELDDPSFPQKGYQLRLDFTGGQKNVHTPPEVVDSTLQRVLPAPSMQYRGIGYFRYFWPMGRHFVLSHCLEAGLLKDDRVYLNDLYRLGGLSTLRGFREKSFFASDYALSRMELRYLASRGTYLFMFYDQSWMVQKSVNLHVTDWPLGVGAGLSLGTSSGTFNIVIGTGASETQSLSFTKSQIHFGYVNRF